MTKLNFIYNNGRGRVEIILDNLLPCTQADFKRLLSFVQLSERPEEHAAVIFSYISGCVADLQKEREKYDPDSAYMKPQRARINTAIKKYISNSTELSKIYGFPEIEDAAAKVTYKIGTVYAIIKNDAGKTVVESFDGWIFKKSGYIFDIYKEKLKKACYRILLHGTGLGVVNVTNRNQAADAITPRVLETLKSADEKISAMREDFKRHMIAAGFMETGERTENISSSETENHTESEEENIMTKYEFLKNTISINGTAYPVEYSLTPKGTIFAYVGMAIDENGCTREQRIRFDKNCKEYPAVLAAVQDSRNHDPRRPENISQSKPAAKIENDPKAVQLGITYTDENGAARDPKTTRGPVPEKTFIGSMIQGHGWKIVFDGNTNRTRVIFDKKPTEAARAAIESAGFYYSPNMKSWNKKLTFKAYRAAQSLSYTLNGLYAA